MFLLVGMLHGCGDKEPSDSGSPPADSGAPDDTADTTDTDTACTTAIFTDEDGEQTDLTEAMTLGTYTTLSDPGTLAVCPGTWFARLLIRADVAVEGLGDDRGQTILSGGESGTILDIGGPRQVTVRNLTLDRGAGLDVDHNSGGGGVYCEQNATVSIEDVTFSRGFANDGAGLYAVSCTVEITDTEFIDNLSEDDGGALTLWQSTATLSGVRFENNTGLDGGAIALFSSDVVIEDTVITDNTSGYFAGGIWQYDSVLTLRDVELSGNINTGGDGGGLLASGTTTLERVTFSDNAAGEGGGVYVYFDTELTGTDCDFEGNSPQDIWVDDYSEAGGVSMDAGLDYSFVCSGNACWEK
jgi:hypothetical protein